MGKHLLIYPFTAMSHHSKVEGNWRLDGRQLQTAHTLTKGTIDRREGKVPNDHVAPKKWGYCTVFYGHLRSIFTPPPPKKKEVNLYPRNVLFIKININYNM